METNNKLREALIKARSEICHFDRFRCQSLSYENGNIQANCADVLCSWRGLCEAKTAINAALAEPVRNCEVGTADDWLARFRAVCERCSGSDCDHRLFKDEEVCDCFSRWLQMPYVEGGAK